MHMIFFLQFGCVHDSNEVASLCLSVCGKGIWHKCNIEVISEGDFTTFIIYLFFALQILTEAAASVCLSVATAL